LRFRRLKPLTWVFGKKGRHDAYGYVCFGGGGIHLYAAAAARGRRGGGAAATARRRSLKRLCLYAERRCYARMADCTVRITGWALKRKS
jgi:hypothetical protein